LHIIRKSPIGVNNVLIAPPTFIRTNISTYSVSTFITLVECDGGLVEWWRRRVTWTARYSRSTHRHAVSSLWAGRTARISSTSATLQTTSIWTDLTTTVS